MADNKDAEMKKQEREQVVELGSDMTKSSKGNIYTHRTNIFTSVKCHRKNCFFYIFIRITKCLLKALSFISTNLRNSFIWNLKIM